MAGARITARVIVRDKGWNRIKSNIRGLDGRGVRCGIIARDAGTLYPGTTVAVVDAAVWNEYGTATSPARPFMRHTADNSKAAVAKAARNTAGRVIFGRSNAVAALGALGALGAWYADRIKATIRNSRRWAAPNAPATIARKGSSTPLIDTRLLLNTISHEVDP